jgi:hypothetical protein
LDDSESWQLTVGLAFSSLLTFFVSILQLRKTRKNKMVNAVIHPEEPADKEVTTPTLTGRLLRGARASSISLTCDVDFLEGAHEDSPRPQSLRMQCLFASSGLGSDQKHLLEPPSEGHFLVAAEDHCQLPRYQTACGTCGIQKWRCLHWHNFQWPIGMARCEISWAPLKKSLCIMLQWSVCICNSISNVAF